MGQRGGAGWDFGEEARIQSGGPPPHAWGLMGRLSHTQKENSRRSRSVTVSPQQSATIAGVFSTSRRILK